MRYNVLHTIITFLMLLLLLTNCNEEQAPTFIMPRVSINPATHITRTGAELNGFVEIIKNGEVNVARFLYGNTTEMLNQIDCHSSLPTPYVTIQGLTPNTTYYYCLEVGNEYQTIRSEIGQFTTAPKVVPGLLPLQLISQGPLSITLQISIADNGGENLSEVGFYCTETGYDEKKLPVSTIDMQTYTHRIDKLKKETSYTIQAYAKNSIGESRSEPYTFQTKSGIVLTQAGTLPEAIDEYEKYSFDKLTISGPLNGTDFRFIREMLGRDVHGNETKGKLASLNLTDADILEGGLSYDYSRHTVTNQITYGLFADCQYLEELYLPYKTTFVEENSFKNCTALHTLYISDNTSQIYSSEGCNNLTNIHVDARNTYLKSIEGVLYNQALTTLFWMPEGKTTINDLPKSLTTIKEFAFRNSRITTLTLPNSVVECEVGTFYGSRLQEITLSDGMTYISNGLLQNCKELKIVRLGENIERLGEYCFDGTPLEELHVQTKDFPPSCHSNTFAGLENRFATCILYVPRGHKNIYKNNDYWGVFECIVEE